MSSTTLLNEQHSACSYARYRNHKESSSNNNRLDYRVQQFDRDETGKWKKPYFLYISTS